MNKANKIVIGFFAVVIAVIVVLLVILFIKSDKDILFYSNTCGHCEIVEEFIIANNVTEKISFEQKEVSKNPVNAAELKSVYEKCELDTNDIRVPLFYYKGECYSGDVEIIKIMNETINSI